MKNRKSPARPGRPIGPPACRGNGVRDGISVGGEEQRRPLCSRTGGRMHLRSARLKCEWRHSNLKMREGCGAVCAYPGRADGARVSWRADGALRRYGAACDPAQERGESHPYA